MKERPILWSAPLVRAHLNTKPGTYPGEPIDPAWPAKWQTRRVMKKQPRATVVLDKATAVATFAGPRGERIDLRCPYGMPGDLLYGRETWSTYPSLDNDKPSEIVSEAGRVWYRADGGALLQPYGVPPTLEPRAKCHGKWRTSIHMPKDFARIWHEIVGVRIERLDAISVEDIAGEGAVTARQAKSSPELARHAWPELWIDVYGEESWNENPWLWVLDLRRIER